MKAIETIHLTAEYLELVLQLPGEIYDVRLNPKTRMIELYYFDNHKEGYGEGMEAPCVSTYTTRSKK